MCLLSWREYNVWCECELVLFTASVMFFFCFFLILYYFKTTRTRGITYSASVIVSALHTHRWCHQGEPPIGSLDSLCLLWKRMTRGYTFSLSVCVCVCVLTGWWCCELQVWVRLNYRTHTHRMMYLCDYVGCVTLEGNACLSVVYVCTHWPGLVSKNNVFPAWNSHWPRPQL